jgi:hypothetical protein
LIFLFALFRFLVHYRVLLLRVHEQVE